MKICIILGTRPEIIKMSPIIKECEQNNLNYFIIHTGQHYNYEMDKIFFKELGINPRKSINLNIGSGTHGKTTGKMIIKIEEVLLKKMPDIVLVQGDTNTVLAGALASIKLNIRVGHVEAGLRSYDRTMPEENNRIIADHISNFNFAPTENSAKILKNEGIDNNKIYITGNTIVDAIKKYSKLAESKSNILKDLDINKNKYFLLTVHRQENVDNINNLKNIFKGLDLINKKFNLPIIFPIHPGTQKIIKNNNIKISKHINLIKPVGFFNFISLEKNAALILTDSGGVQEEVCVLKIPCVTLRKNTERPETVETGSNVLAGTDPAKMLTYTKKMLKKKRQWKNPFGSGRTGKNIIQIITS